MKPSLKKKNSSTSKLKQLEQIYYNVMCGSLFYMMVNIKVVVRTSFQLNRISKQLNFQ